MPCRDWLAGAASRGRHRPSGLPGRRCGGSREREARGERGARRAAGPPGALAWAERRAAGHGGLPASLRGGLRHRVRAAGAEHLPRVRPLSPAPGPGSRPPPCRWQRLAPHAPRAGKRHARSPLTVAGRAAGLKPARLARRPLSARRTSPAGQPPEGGCRPPGVPAFYPPNGAPTSRPLNPALFGPRCNHCACGIFAAHPGGGYVHPPISHPSPAPDLLSQYPVAR